MRSILWKVWNSGHYCSYFTQQFFHNEGTVAGFTPLIRQLRPRLPEFGNILLHSMGYCLATLRKNNKVVQFWKWITQVDVGKNYLHFVRSRWAELFTVTWRNFSFLYFDWWKVPRHANCSKSWLARWFICIEYKRLWERGLSNRKQQILTTKKCIFSHTQGATSFNEKSHGKWLTLRRNLMIIIFGNNYLIVLGTYYDSSTFQLLCLVFWR